MSAALIFSHTVTPRLQYITDFLSHYYGLPFKLTVDEYRYTSSDEKCKINYSYHRISDKEIFIHAHALLFESSVHPVKIECFEKDDHKAFFKTEDDFGFDVFAGIFYLLTRYEEYLPHQKDAYGRYAHENAIAFKEGFLHLPLVNIWLEDFRTFLVDKNPEFKKPRSEFSFLPTYDIDMAWSFKNKGFAKNLGGLLLLLLKGQFKKMAHRIRVIRGRRQDPFDAYGWMDQLHREFNLHPVYFFLVAKEKGKHDKNIDVSNSEFRQLIRSIASDYFIGLHPSWISSDIPSLLSKEKNRLEQMSDRTVTSSRQHFIRFELPETYRRLLNAGIRNDYSMGYGSINGFRASIGSSFYWYDLKNETATELLLHPFCFMDANSYYEQHLTAEAVFQELMEYFEVIKSVNGTMVTIWHNSFLGTDDAFAGWRDVYHQFISSIMRNES
jgi:hypothetical protein